MYVTQIILLGSRFSLAPLTSTEVFLTPCPDSQDPVYKDHTVPSSFTSHCALKAFMFQAFSDS